MSMLGGEECDDNSMLELNSVDAQHTYRSAVTIKVGKHSILANTLVLSFFCVFCWMLGYLHKLFVILLRSTLLFCFSTRRALWCIWSLFKHTNYIHTKLNTNNGRQDKNKIKKKHVEKAIGDSKAKECCLVNLLNLSQEFEIICVQFLIVTLIKSLKKRTLMAAFESLKR